MMRLYNPISVKFKIIVLFSVLSASMRDLFFPGDIIQLYSPDPYPFFSD